MNTEELQSDRVDSLDRCHKSVALSLPLLRGGELSTRLGELAMADVPNDGRRLVPFRPPGDRYVGL